MKRDHLFSIAVFCVVLAACSSAKESTGVWVNPTRTQDKSFHKIFVVVMTADIEARSTVENDLAAAATAKGYEIVKSIDAMPPSLSDPQKPSKYEIVSKVRESGCDGVFVASLLKKEEDIHYTPGTTAYSVMPYYSWSGNYLGYYNHWYPTVSTTGYYTKEKDYFMQSNLYAAATQEIMWSVQSKVFNPSSLKKFSKEYISSLVKQLEKKNLLKK